MARLKKLVKRVFFSLPSHYHRDPIIFSLLKHYLMVIIKLDNSK